MKNNFIFFISIIILLSASSCARHRTYVRDQTFETARATTAADYYEVNGERYYPLPGSSGFVETGLASWYGVGFHGNKTSSGEIYNMYKNSAAHKTLPFGTMVKVRNLSNNRNTIVRINDRGPFVSGRIIDLSYSAAKEILLIGPGTAKVEITALGKEVSELKENKGQANTVQKHEDLDKSEFTIQVGAFKDKNNALRLADRLKVIFDYVNVIEYIDGHHNTLFRLHVSKSDTLAEAKEIEKKLEGWGLTESFIVRNRN